MTGTVSDDTKRGNRPSVAVRSSNVIEEIPVNLTKVLLEWFNYDLQKLPRHIVQIDFEDLTIDEVIIERLTEAAGGSIY